MDSPGRAPRDCWMTGDRAAYAAGLPTMGEEDGDERDECERDLL